MTVTERFATYELEFERNDPFAERAKQLFLDRDWFMAEREELGPGVYPHRVMEIHEDLAKGVIRVKLQVRA